MPCVKKALTKLDWSRTRRKKERQQLRQPNVTARVVRAIGIEGNAMAMGGAGSRAVPYINVTPLIDVLLVLLIIFMVVTPLKPSRFKALIPTPPKEEQSQATAFELNLRVDVAKDLKLQLNGQDIGSVNDTAQLS